MAYQDKVEIAFHSQPLETKDRLAERFLAVRYLQVGADHFVATGFGPEWSRDEFEMQGSLPRWNYKNQKPEYDEKSDSVERLLRREFLNS